LIRLKHSAEHPRIDEIHPSVFCRYGHRRLGGEIFRFVSAGVHRIRIFAGRSMKLPVAQRSASAHRTRAALVWSEIILALVLLGARDCWSKVYSSAKSSWRV